MPEPHCDDCRKRRQSARHDDRVREVVALREQGLLNHEIAERLGVTVATVAMLVSNGRRLGRVEVPDTPYDIVAMVRERARRRREKVERLWAEGLTCRQIAEAMGWYVANAGRHVSALRSVGYNLPYRSHEHRSRVAREARLRYLARQRAAA